MKLLLPIKETVWGPITNQADFNALIRERGQFFGQDLSGRACDFNKAYPCDKTLYQYMGWGPHKGIDIPVSTGTKIYASTSGKITEVSDDTTQGLGLVIWDASQGIETVYWHLLSHSVYLSDIIKAGDLIAISDNTGYSLGSHLHFQVNTTDINGKSGQAIDPINSFVWGNTMEIMSNDFITNFYIMFFGRPADAQELAYWNAKDYRLLFQVACEERAKYFVANKK